MTPDVIGQLCLIALAAALAPIIVELSTRLALPGVVVEIVLGLVLGPQVLNWVTPTGVVLDFANLGLALLMYLAGFELDLRVLRGRPLVLAGISWAGSVLIAVVVALVLLAAGHRHGEEVIALSLTTTAFGTLVPVLRDAGVLDARYGRYILAVGSIGEFGPIVLIALLLSGTDPQWTVLLLLGFLVLAALVAKVVSLPWGDAVTERLRHGLHASSQLPVRISMLLIIALVLLATRLGLDVLLGSFAAGIIVRVALTGREGLQETAIFRAKLEAIGFGFFVPIFFVVSGAQLDVSAVTDHPVAILTVPLFVVLMLLARGLPVLACYRGTLPPVPRQALALLSATGLPLIVVITTIGTANGYVATQTAAALVLAGMLSVLVFPILGLRLLHARGPDRSAPTVDQ